MKKCSLFADTKKNKDNYDQSEIKHSVQNNCVRKDKNLFVLLPSKPICVEHMPYNSASDGIKQVQQMPEGEEERNLLCFTWLANMQYN
jgi:hypothetical protein